jgi:hypothetical protein
VLLLPLPGRPLLLPPLTGRPLLLLLLPHVCPGGGSSHLQGRCLQLVWYLWLFVS